MKNQNDLIALIVSLVVLIAGVLAFFFTAPKVTSPPQVQPVVTAPAQLTAASVVYADALPGGGSNSQAGGGGGGRGADTASAGQSNRPSAAGMTPGR